MSGGVRLGPAGPAVGAVDAAERPGQGDGWTADGRDEQRRLAEDAGGPSPVVDDPSPVAGDPRQPAVPPIGPPVEDAGGPGSESRSGEQDAVGADQDLAVDAARLGVADAACR